MIRLTADGQFDAPTFRAILRQNGLTGKMFVKDQREFHLRQQLMDSSKQSLVPDAFVTNVPHVLKRVARYLIVSLDATDEVGEPTEGELESFFSETKLRFTEPERRDGLFCLSRRNVLLKPLKSVMTKFLPNMICQLMNFQALNAAPSTSLY